MKSHEIRDRFLKYFESQDHHKVKSSSLIPAADPTLLFTNAGMVQFKDCFLGHNDLGYHRATTAQKCVRAGGKHNDLENVGFTPRHHTFFEMLGNFSFGDYFKKDAIHYAWDLLTNQFKIPAERLRVTVFETDDEAFEIWKDQGVRPDWIVRLGEKDNFWAMGDTGPCGPCTEIHYDWGPEYGCGKPNCQPGCPCDTRFLEIWNLVFMQYNRDATGKLSPLPKPSVDTGAGLERLSCVLQGVYSNYQTDLFTPIINAISIKVAVPVGRDKNLDISMRVIADHLRSSTFLIADGVTPSNEGRGYVLRRILRRAIRHGKKLAMEQPFIFELVGSVIETLGNVYPEIVKNRNLIETLIREEETKFHETIHRGMGVIEEAIARATKEKSKALSGDVSFKLYDTFGFPIDLIEVIAKEHNLSVDLVAFEELMNKQREQSAAHAGSHNKVLEAISHHLEKRQFSTQFVGYDHLHASGKIIEMFDSHGKGVHTLELNQEGYALFDVTPFYAESGGQVGDQGKIHGKSGDALVENTFKVGKLIVHKIKISKGNLENQKPYTLDVNPVTRRLTAINHTATHMLHAALRKTLGERIKQAGSLVDSGRLRFDFTYPKGLTHEEISMIEGLVNSEIEKHLPVNIKEMGYDDAIKTGALAFFDEKYGDKVRVVKVGNDKNDFSVELCGGTHLQNSGDIGILKILSESSVASGVRRIEAITSTTALHFLSDRSNALNRIESLLGAKSQVAEKIEGLVSQLKQLQKENEQLKIKVAQSNIKSAKVETKTEKIHDIQFVLEQIPSGDAKVLRALVDQFRDSLKEKTIVVLASQSEGKVSLCVGVTKDLVGRYDAGKIVKEIAPEVGGSGGGRADFAQAGGTKPEGIKAAFSKFRNWLEANP